MMKLTLKIFFLLLLLTPVHAQMQIKVGDTPRIPILMVDETDGETAETGLTVSCQISKNGGAFANTDGTEAELANGWYYVALTATETNTEGFLSIRCTATGADEWRDYHQVGAIEDQVTEVVNVDTFSEPSQGAPPASPTFQQMVHYLYTQVVRNRVVTEGDNDVVKVYADDGTTVIYKQDYADDGTDFDRSEAVTGP